MQDKSLKEKAIMFKGRQYVLVSDRVLFFNAEYPNGKIETELVSPFGSEEIIVKAKVTPDVKNLDRYFAAYSQAVKGEGYINKTSALENAETSAVGRALGFMGIGVIEAIASVDEINKAQTTGLGSNAPRANKKGAFQNIEYLNQEDMVRGNESTKKSISTIAQILAKKQGIIIDTPQALSDWIGRELGFELEPDNYASILNGLKRLHDRK